MANLLTDAWFKITTGKTASQIEAETARANEILARRDAELIARGVWDARDVRDSSAQRAAEDYLAKPPGQQIVAAAAEGASEGLAAMQSSVRSNLGSVATFSLRAVLGWIPWWLWLFGAGYLAWRLGLLDRSIVNRFSR
jgi:hypothetical protein